MPTETKERPLIFSSSMVRALAKPANPKTVTRRLKGLEEINADPNAFELIEMVEQPSREIRGSIVTVAKFRHLKTQDIYSFPCPYGKPGDYLWVRESFWIQMDSEWSEYDQKTYYHSVSLKEDDWANIEYVADNPSFSGMDQDSCLYEKKSSYFMPRWASRFRREIKEIRVERLLEITDRDAISEGLTPLSKDGETVKYGIPDPDGLPGSDYWGWEWQEWNQDPKLAYFHLWDKINGKTYPKKSNPWVFVISFRESLQGVC